MGKTLTGKAKGPCTHPPHEGEWLTVRDVTRQVRLCTRCRAVQPHAGGPWRGPTEEELVASMHIPRPGEEYSAAAAAATVENESTLRWSYRVELVVVVDLDPRIRGDAASTLLAVEEIVGYAIDTAIVRGEAKSADGSIRVYDTTSTDASCAQEVRS